MNCIDDNTAVLFMQGVLAADAARAVEAHVDGCAACGALLAEVARLYVSSAPSVAPSMAHLASGPGAIAPLVSPATIAPSASAFGRYQLAGLLGAGGMGVVFAAYDPILQRRVALKLVRPDRLGDLRGDAQGQLVREAQAAARVAHPNVVAVYDAGFMGGHVFFAMELVEGPTLRAWLGLAPRTAREVVDVFVQAGRGLEAVHAAGLVHCDVKPDNVIVGADGRARIADLGLAAALRAPGDALGGTPAYLAPERLAGWPANAASDQWSFGATLFEALYGTRPANAASWGEMRKAVAAEGTPQDVANVVSSGVMARRPTPRPVTDVPGWLEDVVRRALAPLPASRFASMADLCAALEVGPRRGGPAHVRASVVLQALVWGLDALFVLFASLHAANDGGSGAAAAEGPASSGGLATPEVAVVIAVVAAVAWLPLTLLWAPINAYGLLRRRAWSRTSTLIFGTFTMLGCIGFPLGLYLVYAMTRSSVRTELDR